MRFTMRTTRKYNLFPIAVYSLSTLTELAKNDCQFFSLSEYDDKFALVNNAINHYFELVKYCALEVSVYTWLAMPHFVHLYINASLCDLSEND